jgi:hypothetical protein
MEPWFWITILCATLVYLGMAVSIACWTGTVSSASLATIVYLTASAVLFAVTGPTTLNAAGINRPPASLEAALLLSLDGVWNGRPAAVMRACLVSIVVWTALWIPIGTLSRRRLARG